MSGVNYHKRKTKKLSTPVETMEMNSAGPKEGEAREQENNRALCKFKEYNIPYPFLWFSLWSVLLPATWEASVVYFWNSLVFENLVEPRIQLDSGQVGCVDLNGFNGWV